MVMRTFTPCKKKIFIFLILYLGACYSADALASGMALSVSTNGSTYGLGQKIIINASARQSDGAPIGDVRAAEISIRDGSGKEIHSGTFFQKDPYLFSHEYSIPENARTGGWEVRAGISDISGNSGDARLRITVKNSGDVAGDPVGFAVDTAPGAPEYALGETMTITSHVLDAMGKPLSLKKRQIIIKDGSGEKIASGSLASIGAGLLAYEYATPSSAKEGEWEVQTVIEDMSRNKIGTKTKVNVKKPGDPDDDSRTDRDGDGFSQASGDCNDADPLIHPGATDIPCDKIDQDCDGSDAVSSACIDADNDGFTADEDCNDNNPAINPAAGDIACDGIDQDCDGFDVSGEGCTDADGDGYTADVDCDDNNADIHPGAIDIANNGIDENCDGRDQVNNLPGDLTVTHPAITAWNGTATCISCHQAEALEVHGSPHYQWMGRAPQMKAGPAMQGKLDMGVNSYCINTKGNWNGCGACHIGLGARPEMTVTQGQLENIDCLLCHQKYYKRKKVAGVFVPDTANMVIDMVQAAQTVHLPTRTNCLQCHAKGGGGDNYKRGDLALAHMATTDRGFDVHMATTGGDLACQACHTTRNHLIAGRGSDLRITEVDISMPCTKCHAGKDTANGHSSADIGRHVARVACQTCHIKVYARNASDTQASEMTEIYRSWLKPHITPSGAIHPMPTLAGNLTPKYRWWNGYNTNYYLHAKTTVNPDTGRIPTSSPLGAINETGAKLYPFKYKTALQPFASQRNELIALDTSVYFSTGDWDAATRQGLVNMGYSASEPYTWVETETYQLITHEVMPASQALTCNNCHQNTTQMNLGGELGYRLKGPASVVCSQCHGYKTSKGFITNHGKHVKDKRKDCSWCHTFGRPERGLQLP